jgi:hypothetical protein
MDELNEPVSWAFIQRFCKLWANEQKDKGKDYTLEDANLIAKNVRVDGKRLLIRFWRKEGGFLENATYWVTAESEADLDRLQIAAE